MSTLDLEHLRQWIGKEEISTDQMALRHARLMSATLGLSQDDMQEGMPLPALWHWIYFLDGQPPEALGRDGHPALGGFLPPVPLPNRMWAGGSVTFNAQVPLGSSVDKRSRIQSVEHKRGRSGELVFVTVLHEILHEGKVAISETHDIVYKQASGVPKTVTPMQMPVPTHSKRVQPDSTMLMRYSALTFNGHRIHYDVDYCRNVEGYPNLVIHGPLCATLLAGFAHEVGGRPIRQFRYRGVQPSLLGAELSVNAAKGVDGSDLTMWIGLPDGGVSMRAEVQLQ
ncbi:MAG: MaoC family dehydratase N-terminal domain-containing protein [Alcaligenaceae bacterium]|nr:MaoC family dehydratase N-terminal domain-containing protein [Alcaligenaceae bacterium]